MLDAKVAEAEAELAKADTAAEKRRLQTRKEDLMRLKRIEQIYVSAFVTFARSFEGAYRHLERSATGTARLGTRLVEVALGDRVSSYGRASTERRRGGIPCLRS